MLFDARHDRELRDGPRAAEYLALERRYAAASGERQAAAEAFARASSGNDPAARSAFAAADAGVRTVHADALAFVRDASGDTTYNDVNYVFPSFITSKMPVGLVGLLIAAIFAAAMSASAGELSALTTASIIDFYRRFVRAEASDAHFLKVSRFATIFWGLLASVVAVWASELGSLIEVVNRFGSFFYGSILGVFILAIGFPTATANGAFVGLLAGMGSVAYAATYTKVAFLWHNVIGAVVVVVVGMAVSLVRAPRPRS
jgi:Na+/proline symporter